MTGGPTMSFLALLLVTAAADPADAIAKKMLPIYLQEAKDYSIAVASVPKEPLELKPEPVFEWANPTNNGGQQGVIFVWLRAGRPRGPRVHLLVARAELPRGSPDRARVPRAGP
jgi:hypothetical protein